MICLPFSINYIRKKTLKFLSGAVQQNMRNERKSQKSEEIVTQIDVLSSVIFK